VLGRIFWFLAILTKETAIWALPLWVGCLLVDVVRRRSAVLLGFHLPLALVMCALGIAYVACCAHYFGDGLARLHAVRDMASHHLWRARGAHPFRDRLVNVPFRYFYRVWGPLAAVAFVSFPFLPGDTKI
jgi:hypothetical protein